MFIDLYALQSVPPSNINRDDTGSPKTSLYGGSLRARVSSQAWKRAIREAFAELLPRESLGVRTKLVLPIIVERLLTKNPELTEEEAEKLGVAVLKSIGISLKASTRKGKTEGVASAEYLIFIGEHELDGLVQCAITWYNSGQGYEAPDKEMKKAISAVFHGTQAVDIALFGRMLANAPDLNTDASCQVAHAISVNRVTPEYDYFTAIDDCAEDDNAGAGMLGTVEFNSSTLYRYATVDLDALHQQLGDAQATAAGLRAFTDAFARSMPTGKQNTFANRTLPTTFVIALRSQQPINLVAAFENPVCGTPERSMSLVAEDRLAAQCKMIQAQYGMPAESMFVVSTTGGDAFASLGTAMTLPDALDAVEASVIQILQDGEE